MAWPPQLLIRNTRWLSEVGPHSYIPHYRMLLRSRQVAHACVFNMVEHALSPSVQKCNVPSVMSQSKTIVVVAAAVVVRWYTSQCNPLGYQLCSISPVFHLYCTPKIIMVSTSIDGMSTLCTCLITIYLFTTEMGAAITCIVAVRHSIDEGCVK